jgi:hypothetical protein
LAPIHPPLVILSGPSRSYNTTSFKYDNLPFCSAFTSLPVGKVPHFDGTKYTKWKYTMKVHLSSLHSSVLKVVCTGVEFPDEDKGLGFEQLQQRMSLIEWMVKKRLRIFGTLQRAHEGTKLMKKAKIQLIEGQLDRFVMLEDKSPQKMFNRLKRLVNKII